MNSRERLIAVLNGQIPDRVPISFFVQEEFLSFYYPERKVVRRLEEAVDCATELGFDIMVRSKAFEFPHFMKKSFTNWELKSFEKIENNNLYTIFEINTPGGTLRQIEAAPYLGRAGSGIHRSVCEYLIKEEQDFDIFQRYVPEVDNDTINEMKAFAIHSREVIGDKGICVPWGWAGVYNQASNYRNVQELMIDAYTEPDFYNAFMQKITDMEISFNSFLAEFSIDAIGIQGNIANSGMVGKDFFETYIMPYEKQLVDAIKSKNKFTVYHNCGKAKVLRPSYVEMGLTAWETIAEHPQGDNTLIDAKREVGDKLVLIGNIDQVNFLKTASGEQIREKVEEIISIGKVNGRYIFASSDFLEKGTPVENIIEAIAAAKYFGQY